MFKNQARTLRAYIMKRKDFGTDEEGCRTVDFVQIELQRGKTLLLNAKIRVSVFFSFSFPDRIYKFDCEKKIPNRRCWFSISAALGSYPEPYAYNTYV